MPTYKHIKGLSVLNIWATASKKEFSFRFNSLYSSSCGNFFNVFYRIKWRKTDPIQANTQENPWFSRTYEP